MLSIEIELFKGRQRSWEGLRNVEANEASGESLGASFPYRPGNESLQNYCGLVRVANVTSSNGYILESCV